MQRPVESTCTLKLPSWRTGQLLSFAVLAATTGTILVDSSSSRFPLRPPGIRLETFRAEFKSFDSCIDNLLSATDVYGYVCNNSSVFANEHSADRNKTDVATTEHAAESHTGTLIIAREADRTYKEILILGRVFVAWHKAFLSSAGAPIGDRQYYSGFVKAVLFPLCHLAFPVRHSRRLCPNVCSEFDVAISTLRKLVQSDLLRMLTGLAQGTCARTTLRSLSNAADRHCVFGDLHEYMPRSCLAGVRRTNYPLNKTSPKFAGLIEARGLHIGSLCLRMTCPYPLRRTSSSSRWEISLQRYLESTYAMTASALNGSVMLLKHNGSLLGCGIDCVAIGYSKTDEKVSRLLVGTMSAITVASISFSMLVFYYNRQRASRFPIQRVAFLIRLSGGFTLLSYLPALDFSQELFCDSDGTLMMGEALLQGSSACLLVAFWNSVTTLTVCGYTMALAHSWKTMMGKLRKTRLLDHVRPTGAHEYKAEIIYTCLSLTVALSMSFTVLVQNGFGGYPLLGTCLISTEGGYHIKYFATYLCVTLLLSQFFLYQGLKHLCRHRPGVKRVALWMLRRQPPEMPSVFSSSSPSSYESVKRTRLYRRRKRVDRLAWRMFMLVVGLVMTIPGLVTQAIFIQVKGSDWMKQTKQNIFCNLINCHPQTCPPLPSMSILLAVVPIIAAELALLTSTVWAYSPKAVRKIPFILYLTRWWRGYKYIQKRMKLGSRTTADSRIVVLQTRMNQGYFFQ